ncbi:efflux transporter, RND family, MFP subunit [Bacteroides coprosuis DSM 18011]|uniref:Efflux transporter, RND family, MFP subunit n=1 Tax=Bacteroides coprosuis DSM 18011 TaxID=679937 RepID=F3ZSV6_9BACE|nr:efflux RND transporter periplasmic adaptor subunit [Bacteroides coprosuis]EGJ72197.1 efflux transporter, RND family, MFP subunit [Bacteroides coprosuis DSM 18011]
MKPNNKFKQITSNRYFYYSVMVFIGIFLGWVFFGRGGIPHSHDSHGDLTAQKEESQTIWTCAMHPQIKQDKPGKCPICGMDLTPMRSSEHSDEMIDANAIQLSPEAIALAHVQTTTISTQNPVKEISLYGTVQADERLSQSQTSHVNGRIEKLFINFTGETIRKGQTIATIYSPDLLNAQQELLEAKKLIDIQPMLLDAAREKLRLWKLSNEQIHKIEASGKVSPTVDIKANTGGIVVEKKVSEGDYVNQGSVLFNISNLSQVWVLFDAYEGDLPFLKVGNQIEFSLQAVPNKTYQGKISFIDPILNKTTRTAKVRVVTSNPGMVLKPEMYASAKIKASLGQHYDQIVVPKSAVLWTGKRSIVYVKQPDVESSAFLLREVDLGPSLGNAYVINYGLKEGEQVVTNGAFVIDASAQLEGKRSMMNEVAGAAITGHEHHTMNGSNTEHKANEHIQQKSEHNHNTREHENHSFMQEGVPANSEHTMIQVSGACEMCKERIEKAARSVKGVESAQWDIDSQRLHLNYDKKQTDTDQISKAIAAVGHDTEKYKADDAVYNALPSCCKYRK